MWSALFVLFCGKNEAHRPRSGTKQRTASTRKRRGSLAPSALSVAAVELFEESSPYFAGFSAGFSGVVAFSVSIFHDPRVVFLDEPTGGVDPETRRQFWELIYDAARRGITVFVTTHYMDEAEYCDRISIMVDGKIEALGTPAELKRHFDQPDMDHVFTLLARRATRSAD